MNLAPLAILGLGASLVLSTRPAQAGELEELIGKADRVLRGTTSAAVLKMEIKTKSYSRSYKIVLWDDSSGREDKTLVKILGPASFRGYATLRIGNQLKFYDPKTDHVQVVGQSMLGDSWMGSHFSNDDLIKETRLARDYSASLLDRHEGKNELGDVATFYKIRLFPKPSAPVAWGRITFELFRHGAAVLPVETDYFNKPQDATPARRMLFSAIKVFDGRPVPSVLEVRVTDKPGEFTRITYEELRFDVKIPPSKFTEQAMR
jgi:Outer membrane lipoprotein-sorting protein